MQALAPVGNGGLGARRTAQVIMPQIGPAGPGAMAVQAAELVASRQGPGRSHWLYEHEYGDLSGMLGQFDGMLRIDHRWQITSLILISKSDVLGCADRLARPPFFAEVQRVDQSGGTATVMVSRDDSKPWRVRIAKTPDPFVYVAVTDGDPEFVRHTLEPFVKSLYPVVSQAFLSSGEMRGVLDAIERRSEGAVKIVRMTACRRPAGAGAAAGLAGPGAGDPDGGGDGREATVTYADVPYRNAFDEAGRGNQRIDSVRMHLVRGDVPVMDCQVSRRGILRFRLSMQPFCSDALPYMTGLASGKVRLYSGRSRRENGGRVKALAIALDADVFRDGRENDRFVRIVRSMPHTMGSTFCSSPYVHMSLVDFLDGSTFDIWVASEDRITIVPQLKANHASIARVINHIFERFGEGRVEEHQEQLQ